MSGVEREVEIIGGGKVDDLTKANTGVKVIGGHRAETVEIISKHEPREQGGTTEDSE
jgi:hypothetical protein